MKTTTVRRSELATAPRLDAGYWCGRKVTEEQQRAVWDNIDVASDVAATAVQTAKAAMRADRGSRAPEREKAITYLREAGRQLRRASRLMDSAARYLALRRT